MRGSEYAELTAFAAVAERQSFVKAATFLNISPASITATIRSLEERLGVRLLNRTTRSVALTDAGARLLEELRPLLEGFDAVLESVNAFRDKPMGALRLTVPHPAATAVLAPILSRFLSEYPDIELEISADSALTDIVAGHYDAGIRVGEMVSPGMIAVRLTDEVPAVVVASPDYVARHGTPASPRELRAYNCIRMRFGSGAIAPWTFVENGANIEIAVHGNLILNDTEMQLRAAEAGVGLVYMTLDSATALLAQGRLVTLLEEYSIRRSGWFLYYASRRQVPGPLRAFIDFLKANRAPAPRVSRGRAPRQSPSGPAERRSSSPPG